GSCAAPSAKGDDKFITTDYLQQCPSLRLGTLRGQGAKKVKMYSPGCPEVKENRHTAERRIALFAKWTSVLLCYSCFNG
ncbi:hypothetical protein, partial [Escherichia coli]